MARVLKKVQPAGVAFAAQDSGWWATSPAMPDVRKNTYLEDPSFMFSLSLFRSLTPGTVNKPSKKMMRIMKEE